MPPACFGALKFTKKMQLEMYVLKQDFLFVNAVTFRKDLKLRQNMFCVSVVASPDIKKTATTCFLTNLVLFL